MRRRTCRGKDWRIAFQGFRADHLLQVFRGLAVIDGALRAQQAFVGHISDQVGLKDVLPAQIRYTPTFANQTGPLQVGQIVFEIRPLFQQRLQYIRPKHRSNDCSDLEDRTGIYGDVINTGQQQTL